MLAIALPSLSTVAAFGLAVAAALAAQAAVLLLGPPLDRARLGW